MEEHKRERFGDEDSNVISLMAPCYNTAGLWELSNYRGNVLDCTTSRYLTRRGALARINMLMPGILTVEVVE